MVFVNWMCFIIVCLDVVSYIIEQGIKIAETKDIATSVAKFIGLCVGIACRVYILYNAVNYWLLA